MSDREEFVRIDVAKSPFEAKLVVSILKEAGIPAYIDGANLQDEFAISQALMNNAGVRITVRADQVEAAYAAINAARETPLEREPADDEASADGSSGRRTGFSTFGTASFLAAIVFFVLWQTASAEASALRGEDRLFSSEGWERGVRWYWKDSRNLYMETVDENRDNVYEMFTLFNRDGARSSVSHDKEENGVVERLELFTPGREKMVSQWFDRDENGLFEERIEYYPDGGQARWHDRDGDGIFEAREFLDEKGKLLFTEEDRGRGGFVRR